MTPPHTCLLTSVCHGHQIQASLLAWLTCIRHSRRLQGSSSPHAVSFTLCGGHVTAGLVPSLPVIPHAASFRRLAAAAKVVQRLIRAALWRRKKKKAAIAIQVASTHFTVPSRQLTSSLSRAPQQAAHLSRHACALDPSHVQADLIHHCNVPTLAPSHGSVCSHESPEAAAEVRNAQWAVASLQLYCLHLFAYVFGLAALDVCTTSASGSLSTWTHPLDEQSGMQSRSSSDGPGERTCCYIGW